MARRSRSIERNEFAAYGGDVAVDAADPTPPSAPPPGPRSRWTTANVALAFAVAVFGSVLGIPAAFAESLVGGGGASLFAVILVIVIGPAVEEVVKPIALIFLLERAPHRVLGRMQIWLSAALAGAGFAVVENLIYIHVYIPAMDTPPTFDVAAWRWTVCTTLHVVCSSVMGIGLAREHTHAMREGRSFELERVVPIYAVAVVIHGLYNAYAVFGLP